LQQKQQLQSPFAANPISGDGLIRRRPKGSTQEIILTPEEFDEEIREMNPPANETGTESPFSFNETDEEETEEAVTFPSYRRSAPDEPAGRRPFRPADSRAADEPVRQPSPQRDEASESWHAFYQAKQPEAAPSGFAHLTGDDKTPVSSLGRKPWWEQPMSERQSKLYKELKQIQDGGNYWRDNPVATR